MGVDRCRGGWVYVRLGNTVEPSWGVSATLAGVLELTGEADVVVVDVPIGLLEGGSEERTCDSRARALLGPAGRGSSVFPVPCREAVYTYSYAEASRINEERTGRKLSKQTWGIVPGIREADELMRSSAVARDRLAEGHPEVLFWALAGGKAMPHSKRSQDGLLERVALLERVYPGVEEIAAAAFVDHGGYRVDRHDVVDACVGAVTAAAFPELDSIPEDPPLDPRGIPMRMVHAPLV